MKKQKVHLLDQDTMIILKEYNSVEEALEGTKRNAPTIFLGLQGIPRAYELNEFRQKFGVK